MRPSDNIIFNLVALECPNVNHMNVINMLLKAIQRLLVRICTSYITLYDITMYYNTSYYIMLYCIILYYYNIL